MYLRSGMAGHKRCAMAWRWRASCVSISWFHSAEWNQEIETQLARQRQAMAQRLWPAIPDRKYICFYPMDRRRGESVNWYQVPMAERQRLMHEHGMVGRRYADDVKQIITGSIGFDDWEWGVDLFAEDPLVF